MKAKTSSDENLSFFHISKMYPTSATFPLQNRAIINLSAATGPPQSTRFTTDDENKSNKPIPGRKLLQKIPTTDSPSSHPEDIFIRMFLHRKKAHSELQRNSDHVRVVNLFSFGQFSPFPRDTS